jgi:predicted  nucleic acid-binding Zn-ribbon protein
MEADPFVHFIRFIECEHGVRIAQQRSEQLTAALGIMAQEKTQEEQHIAAVKEQARAFLRQMHTYEHEMHATRTRQQSLQKRLTTANPREYTALHDELETLEQQNKQREEALLQAWQDHEIAQAHYEKEQSAHEQWLAEYTQRVASNEREQANLLSEIDRLKHECSTLQQGVESTFLTDYLFMKKSVANPVVPIIDGACSACHYHISPQDLALARRHVLIHCKECFRKLYIPLASRGTNT